MKSVLGIAALVLLGAGSAGAQVQPPQDRIATSLSRAREVGIPVSLLESKIAEGKAKGVSMDRIAAAVERREAALERAHDALRGQPDEPASLGVAADAVESGVSVAVLKAVSEDAPRERRNVAIAALTELVRQGRASETALEQVREALKHGPDALANLPAEAGGGHSRSGPGGHGGDDTVRSGQSGPPPAVPPPGRTPGSDGSGGSSGPGGSSGSSSNSGPGSRH
jgi:uncharacterized membrane protein YgcG